MGVELALGLGDEAGDLRSIALVLGLATFVIGTSLRTDGEDAADEGEDEKYGGCGEGAAEATPGPNLAGQLDVRLLVLALGELLRRRARSR